MMPVHVASVPLFMFMLLMLPNGAGFMGTKSPAVSTEMKTGPGVLPSPALTSALVHGGAVQLQAAA